MNFFRQEIMFFLRTGPKIKMFSVHIQYNGCFECATSFQYAIWNKLKGAHSYIRMDMEMFRHLF